MTENNSNDNTKGKTIQNYTLIGLKQLDAATAGMDAIAISAARNAKVQYNSASDHKQNQPESPRAADTNRTASLPGTVERNVFMMQGTSATMNEPNGVNNLFSTPEQTSLALKMLQSSGIPTSTNSSINDIPSVTNRKKEVKNSRVGIFGNHLASRISTIQQQKYIMTQNPGTSVKYSTQAASTKMPGDSIGSRKKSATQNSQVRYAGGQRANVRLNSNVAVTDPTQNIFLSNGSHFGSMTSSAVIVDEANLNSLDFPPSQRGSQLPLVTVNGKPKSPFGPTIGDQQPVDGIGKYSKYYQIMTGVDGVELRQSLLDASVIVGNEKEIGNKSQMRAKQNNSAANSNNYSYKGNLNKLLRKARVVELEQQQQKFQQKNPFPASVTTVPPVNLIQQAKLKYEVESKLAEDHQRKNNRSSALVHPAEFSHVTQQIIPPQIINSSNNNHSSLSRINHQQQAQLQQIELFQAAQRQKQPSHASFIENLRNYAHTPLTDAMINGGGNLSPMQVRSGRNNLNERDANNSIGAVVHRSVEGKPTSMAGARIRQQQVQVLSAGKRPLVRGARQLSPSEVNMTAIESNKIGAARQTSDRRVASQAAHQGDRNNQAQPNRQEQSNKRSKSHLTAQIKEGSPRPSGRIGGLGSGLEERQMNVIDTIWGNFKDHQKSQKQLAVGSARVGYGMNVKGSQPVVQLVPTSKSKAKRNEELQQRPVLGAGTNLTATEEAAMRHTGTAIFLQQPLKPTSNAVVSDENPVWLPKKSPIQLNEGMGLPAAEQSSGRRSQAIEEATSAFRRIADESFDYRDFNFIVGKHRGHGEHKYAKHGHRSNSPAAIAKSGRYEEPKNKPHSMSENYHPVRQYGLNSVPSGMLAPLTCPGGGLDQERGPTSIKIQIAEAKQREALAVEKKRKMMPLESSMLMHSSQSNPTAKQVASNYLNFAHNKKNLLTGARPLKQEDQKQMYHVKISIDAMATPANRQSPSPIDPQQQHVTPTSLYHQYNLAGSLGKQTPVAVPVKQHSIHGMDGVQTPASEAHRLSELVESQILAAHVHQHGNKPPHQSARNAVALSPRGVDRKHMVFSPEPRLIELPGDETRAKPIPTIVAPVIPKRQARPRLPGQGYVEEKGLGPCIQRSPSQDEMALPDTWTSADQGGGGDEEDKVRPQDSAARPKRQLHYPCPYARERKEKQRQLEEQKAAAAGEGSATEEADQRTAEQKAEDLKEHQRELMRKFVSKFPPRRPPDVHAELEAERQRFVQARKDANKKYTEISANNNKPGKFAPLKFVIYEGNNSNILRRVMQSRLASHMPAEAPSSPTAKMTTSASDTNEKVDQVAAADPGQPQNFSTWQETNAPHLFNFKWKPTSGGINFERLGKFGYKQLVNHIEGHGALTTKDQLFFNMKAYCEKKNLAVYSILPLTFAVDFQDPDHRPKFDQILQVISTVERNIGLGPAELSMKLQAGQAAFDKALRSPLSVGPSEHQGKNLWLLKPTGFNRGIGIHVFNSLDDLQSILWTHYRISVTIPSHYRGASQASSGQASGEQPPQGTRDFAERNREIQKLSSQIAQDEDQADPEAGKAGPGGVKEIKNHSFIVQKYIEAPLLFRKRKFDIRIWALISHDAKLYLFKEAYVRTSSEEYDLSGAKLDQVYVHLTNNAVQKYSKNYGKFEEGNIVSVKTLSQELAQQEQFGASQGAEQIERALYRQMREQILHSYEAIRGRLKFSKHSFELVGYDFMVVPVIDPDGGASDASCSFATKLIEANTNPCLEESNQLLKDLIPRMLDDMLKITLDPLFGTSLVPNEIAASESETGLPVILNYPVEGYENGENMFELLASPAMPP